MGATPGNFEVIEGEVQEFDPMPFEGHRREIVGRGPVFGFHTLIFDFTPAAFNRTASHGGPIRERRYLRISHHGDRILKIDVRK